MLASVYLILTEIKLASKNLWLKCSAYNSAETKAESKRQPIEGRVKVIVEKFGSARKFSKIVENTKFDTEV